MDGRDAEVRASYAAQGAFYGVIAGALFLVAQLLYALAAGTSPAEPLRLMASISLGPDALAQPVVGGSISTTSMVVAVIIGLANHVVISALYGLLFGLAYRTVGIDPRGHMAGQVAAGAVYGVLVWAVSFQLIARAGYPWFLETSQLAQCLMHALAYGAPLCVMLAASARSPVLPPPRPSIIRPDVLHGGAPRPA